MIVDSHCHAGEGDGFTGPWDTRAPLARYLRRARQAGIVRTVVFAAFHTDYAAANRSVWKLTRRFPERLLGFVMVHTARDRGRIVNIVGHAVRHWGFVGIKIHRHDAPISREVCEAARRFELPVLYDPAGDAHPLGLVAREFPTVRFIVPHFGSFSDDYKAHDTVIDLIARLPNVYADTSGMRRFDYLVEAVKRAGPSKILFGSDGPYLHPGLELAKVRLLGLPPRYETLITGANLLRLIREAKGHARLRAPCDDCSRCT